MRKIKIVSVGRYLPKRIVQSVDLEQKLNLPQGWIESHQGVKRRYWIEDETSPELCYYALKDALQKSQLDIQDIDCIVCTSGTISQPIPCNAILVAQMFGAASEKIPCFDINATCLGSLMAWDTLSYLIDSGRYKRVAIVSGDIQSIGLNDEDCKTYTLFGDAGSAIIIEKDSTSAFIDAKFESFPQFKDLACIKGGGNMMPGWVYSKSNPHDYQFHMDGEKIYMYSARRMPEFLNSFLEKQQVSLDNIDMIIPHQASFLSLKLMQKKLKIPDDKFMINIENIGNTVSSSITLALFDAIEQNRIKRGDKVLFLGTSAGLTIGALYIEY